MRSSGTPLLRGGVLVLVQRQAASFTLLKKTSNTNSNASRITSRHSAASAFRSVAEPLQKALFDVDEQVVKTAAELTPQEAYQRATISMAMKHLVRKRTQAQNKQDLHILRCREEALCVLYRKYPILYDKALHFLPYHDSAPLERRMLTLTPPSLDNKSE